MSYNYYKMLADIQTENKLKRSRIEFELNINRSPARKIMQKEEENYFQERDQLKNQIQEVANYIRGQNNRLQKNSIQGLQSLAAQSQMQRCERQSVLRRSRLQAEIRTDKITRNIQKSRLQAQLLGSRLFATRSIQDGIRKFKVQTNVQYLLKKN